MALTRSHSGPNGPVEAAGAVLWRPGLDGPELALIHRPRYDDWSFPKGKQDPGEHIQLTAMREVLEETGQQMLLGRRLSEISYPLSSSGAMKRVRYWAARTLPDGEAGSRFEPNHEVDRLAWLTPEEAMARLTRRLDTTVLGSFLAAPVDTVPIVLLRHTAAERRSRRYPDDRIRPLTAQGHAQAEALAGLLACFGRTRIVSSPAVRCVDTVRPVAGSQRTIIDVDPALSEAAHAAAPRAAASWMRVLIAEGEPAVVCSHREVLDALLAAVLARAGVQVGAAVRLPGTQASRTAARPPAPLVNGRPWSRRERERLLGSDGGGGKLAPGRAWVLHVTRRLGPRRLPRLVAIDRLRL